MLHGAVLGLEDTGLIVVGPGGAGKSTSVGGGLSAGLQTCGDDYAWVERHDEGQYVARLVHGTIKTKKSTPRHLVPALVSDAASFDAPLLDKRAHYVAESHPSLFLESIAVRGSVRLDAQAPPGIVSLAHRLDVLRGAAPSSVLQASHDQGQTLAFLTRMVAELPSFSLGRHSDLRRHGEALASLVQQLRRGG